MISSVKLTDLSVVTSASLSLVVHLSRLFDPRRPSLCSRSTHRCLPSFRCSRGGPIFSSSIWPARNWFIAGQSMNNSSQPIRSPINLGRKAKWVVGVDGIGRRVVRHEGGKRKAALAKPLSLMCTTSESSCGLGWCVAEPNSDATGMGNAFSGVGGRGGGSLLLYEIHAVICWICDVSNKLYLNILNSRVYNIMDRHFRPFWNIFKIGTILGLLKYS